MSVHISSHVWKHSRASGAALLLLVSLADQANDDGQCWPSYDKIAERCRVSRSSVHRYLRQLRELGELEWEDRSSSNRPSAYTIILADPRDPSATDAETPADAARPSVNLTLGQAADPGKLSTDPVSDCDGASVTADTGPVSDWDWPSVTTDTGPVSLLTHRTVSKNVRTRNMSEAAATDAALSTADELCNHLAAAIERNGVPRPMITPRWLTACQLMLDRDGITPDQIRAAIDWAQAHEFWRANILSFGKLREKYPQLVLQAKRKIPTSIQTPRPPKTNEACPTHGGWKHNCSGCRADKLVGDRALTKESA